MTEFKKVALHWAIGLPVAGAMSAWVIWSPSTMPLWLTIALWTGSIATIGYLFYASSAWLFGPVLFYELIRGARSARVPVLRVVYALTLLLCSFLVYVSFAAGEGADASLSAVFEGARVDPNQMAAFAGAFFQTFLALQIGLVFLLTPAFVAGSISGEKQSGTLDFLLASDLTTREIVLGKLGSRLANLLLLLLTGLPILSFLQMMGGVDPNLLLAGFAVTLMTLVSQGAMSMAASVLTMRPRSAIFSVYLITAGYMLGSYIFCCCSLPGLGPLSAIGWLASGNVFSAWTLVNFYAANGSLDLELPWILGRYAIFHTLVIGISMVIAMRWLRPRGNWKYRPAVPRNRPRPRPPRRPIRARPERPKRWRPYIGDRAPMLWKELFFEAGLELPGVVHGIVLAVGVITLSTMALVFLFGSLMSVRSGEVSRFSQGWVWICSGVLAQVLLLGIALRGSMTFSKEKDQQTLDSLLTTPLTDQEILWAKWVSCLWSVRYWAIALAVFYFLALITGGLHPIAVPLVVLAVAVHAAFAAALGMYCSVLSSNSLRATIATVSALALIGAGHWLLALVLQPLAYVYLGKAQADLVYSIHLWGLTPPFNLAAVSFSFADLEGSGYNSVAEGGSLERFLTYRLVPGLCGILLYGAATVGLLWAVRRQLARYRD